MTQTAKDRIAAGLRLPVIAAPMFLVSGPDLVVECCKAGILGSFPSLNQRSTAGYADWLDEIAGRLPPGTGFAVNLIAHASNARLGADLAETVARRVPVVITSLGLDPDLIAAVHGYGGVVLHDVGTPRHAENALAAGVDGLIAVAAGAGGHTGRLHPFALVSEIRAFFGGPLALGGAISSGREVAAARALGADFAYVGTRLIATDEAMASPGYKAMLAEARASDIRLTDAVTGTPANFMRQSLDQAGIVPGETERRTLDLGDAWRAWRDIWSAGHGVGSIAATEPAARVIARMQDEYRDCLAAIAEPPNRRA